MEGWSIEKVTDKIKKKPVIAVAVVGGAALVFFLFSRSGGSDTVELSGYPVAPEDTVGAGAAPPSGVSGAEIAGMMGAMLDSLTAAQQSQTAAILAGQNQFNDTLMDFLSKWQIDNEEATQVLQPSPYYEQPQVLPEGGSLLDYARELNNQTTTSRTGAYHEGVTIGPTNYGYLDSWAVKSGVKTYEEADIIAAISREQGVDLGIAQDMYKVGTRPTGVFTSSGGSSRTTSGSSSGGSTSGSRTGSLNLGKGSASGQAAADNESRLRSDSSFVTSEKARTAQVIRDRESAGLDTSAQRAYQQRLNTGSW